MQSFCLAVITLKTKIKYAILWTNFLFKVGSVSQTILINQILEKVRDMDVTMSAEAAQSWVGARLSLLKPFTWEEAHPLINLFTMRGAPPLVFEGVMKQVQCTDEERAKVYKLWFDVYSRKWNVNYNRTLHSLLDGMPLLEHALRIISEIPDMERRISSTTRQVLVDIMDVLIDASATHPLSESSRQCAQVLNTVMPSLWRQKILEMSRNTKNFSGLSLTKEVNHWACAVIWCEPFMGKSLQGALAQSLKSIHDRVQDKTSFTHQHIWQQIDALATKHQLQQSVVGSLDVDAEADKPKRKM